MQTKPSKSIGKPRETKAHLLQKQAAEKKLTEAVLPDFKMKRFSNVQSRISSRRQLVTEQPKPAE